MSIVGLFVCVAVYGLWVITAHALLRGPRPDPWTGLAAILNSVYVRIYHRARFDGQEHARGLAGPLVVVANHTSGIDPLLVQAAVPFFVRWMMGEQMMLEWARGLWDFIEVIGVDMKGRDSASARQAIRAIESGNVIGIFPEGSIERPARTLDPFMPGVGLIVHKTKARVLPVVIEGTPYTATAWGSLFVRGKARVRVMPPIDYAALGLHAQQIAADLQSRYQEWTGWPVTPHGDAE